MTIRNTTEDMKDPGWQMLAIGDAMANGGKPGHFIEEMERDGQAQLVNSDRLPTRFNVFGQSQAEAQAEFEALGFTFGEPDESDPLFRPATLPAGWKREGGDHAMWSYVVDQHGRQRVSIFYKAAWYDRDAFMSLTSLTWYVTCHVEHDGPLVITGDWATRDAVMGELVKLRDFTAKEAAEFRGYAADTARRDPENRERCAELADGKEETAARYQARLEELTGGTG